MNPRAIATEGWLLHRPPLPKIWTPQSCKEPGAPAAGCDPDKCMRMRQLITAKHNHSYADMLCERCECSLCLICAKLVNRWSTPLGQMLESVTTRTHPPFTFAFKPDDDDMARMRQQLILEPTLTHAWHEATWRCCRRPGGLVVDVGGNFGWYTLYSLALGCSVAVFEPVPTYREVLRLGVTLNPGFGERVRLYGNVVYDTPGNYTLRVPIAGGKHRKKLGMTGMAGSRGVLKSDFNAKAYSVVASSVRIDDLIQSDACLLKADVEGYEPQVLQTAQKLLSTRLVPALQLELTRTPKSPDQTCATIKTLEHLDRLGYDFRQAPHALVDARAPSGSWRNGPSAWDRLPPFPSAAARARHASGGAGAGGASLMKLAYEMDFSTHSTNLVGRLDTSRRPKSPPPWPTLAC
jgi:FkbM family methyltransferase